MRIWHQSFSDLSRLPRYAKRLRIHASRVVEAGTHVELHGMDDAASIGEGRSACVEHHMVDHVLRAAWEAERSGFDALTIGCVYDPGLREARSMVDIPVLGMTETVMLIGSLYGRQVGLVSLDANEALAAGDLVDSYRLSGRLACSDALDEPVTEAELDELGDCWPLPLIESVDRARLRCIRAGAEVVVAAEGVLNEHLVAARSSGSTESKQVAAGFLDAIGLLWKQAEAAVAQRRSLGLAVSRLRYYSDPGGDGARLLARQLGSTM